MANKITQKATEQRRSTSPIDQQQQSAELRFNVLTDELSIDGAPLLPPHDSQQVDQLARKLCSILKQADVSTGISLHVILKTFSIICQSTSEEYGMEEEHHQYVN